MKSLKERFNEKWIPVSESGCWLWIGSISGNMGYGEIQRGDGTKIKAHRLSYELHVGSIPNNQRVLHKCDVPQCVNPHHLFLGSMHDNAIDMIYKGRHNHVKLSKSDVVHILTEKANAPSTSTKYFANKYNVSLSAIQRIIARKSWKHLAFV